jgi:SAM-dependent methyltransferase
MSDWLPMDEGQSALQIEAILSLLPKDPQKVIDVGCGDGRILIPLAVAGHNMIGVDFDANAISACASRCSELDVDANLIDADVFDAMPMSEPVDAIVCCGQTLMLIHDVDEAVALFKLFRKSLKKGGIVILDDLPGDLWPEVAEGRWANGVNEEGTLQLVWECNDAVFAIREGDQVDSECWELKKQDRKLRLWTMGSLRLAAKLADLSAPTVPVAGAILVMRAD